MAMEVCIPANESEFKAQFGSEQKCYDRLAEMQSNIFTCPVCQSGKGRTIRRSVARGYTVTYRVCRDCGRHLSPIAGTLLHRVHASIQTLCYLFWFAVGSQVGLNIGRMKGQDAKAMGLEFSGNKTSARCLDLVRSAMAATPRLSGEVQFGVLRVRHPRARESKPPKLVGVALQLGSGQVRLRMLPDLTAEVLAQFIALNLHDEAVVYASNWKGYSTIGKCTCVHLPSKQLVGSFERAFTLTNELQRVEHYVKECLNAVGWDSINVRNLDGYLAEIEFRFNNRQTHSQGERFVRLLRQALNPVQHKA